MAVMPLFATAGKASVPFGLHGRNKISICQRCPARCTAGTFAEPLRYHICWLVCREKEVAIIAGSGFLTPPVVIINTQFSKHLPTYDRSIRLCGRNRTYVGPPVHAETHLQRTRRATTNDHKVQIHRGLLLDQPHRQQSPTQSFNSAHLHKPSHIHLPIQVLLTPASGMHSLTTPVAAINRRASKSHSNGRLSAWHRYRSSPRQPAYNSPDLLHKEPNYLSLSGHCAPGPASPAHTHTHIHTYGDRGSLLRRCQGPNSIWLVNACQLHTYMHAHAFAPCLPAPGEPMLSSPARAACARLPSGRAETASPSCHGALCQGAARVLPCGCAETVALHAPLSHQTPSTPAAQTTHGRRASRGFTASLPQELLLPRRSRCMPGLAHPCGDLPQWG